MTEDFAEVLEAALLRAAANAGVTSLDQDERIRIPAGDLRGYLRERGRLATERAAATAPR